MNKYIHVKNVRKQLDKDFNKFILDTESRYRGQLFTLVNKILSKNNVQIVLLAGPSCAGKTTTANLIKQVLEIKGREVDVVSMDDFFIDLDERKILPNGNPDFDSPDILNYKLMKETFSKYFSGEDTYFPEYDFKNSKSIPNKNLHKYKFNTIVIFEGIHVLNPRVLKNLGTDKYFRLYVSPITSFKTDKKLLTSKNLRLLRRVVRDIKRRSTSAEKTINMWPEVTEVEEKYIEPFRTKVDYFVDTTHPYELGVYKGELSKFIEDGKIKPEEIPFKEFLDDSYVVSKGIIPDTSLMWEFVDKD
jgi:uridine kinase